ncbi:hypothetical protein [Marinitoga sp. 1138]|uniref:hypothetical protein n=1 Tax=Marinitoga sp. 1138 TaxID=1643334 RepID=UPI0015866C02|nr:hypothetical protein [Marinitoga sp. 1138]NUU96907.1 hypothetical protein [Marinitoga sp. 1138]
MKLLGRGLETFFDEKRIKKSFVKENNNIEELYEKAKEFDIKGNYLMAFHYYMLVSNSNASNTIKAKALNNAAILLAEHEFESEAIEFLEKGFKIDPNNMEISENLKILRGSE